MFTANKPTNEVSCTYKKNPVILCLKREEQKIVLKNNCKIWRIGNCCLSTSVHIPGSQESFSEVLADVGLTDNFPQEAGCSWD